MFDTIMAILAIILSAILTITIIVIIYKLIRKEY